MVLNDLKHDALGLNHVSCVLNPVIKLTAFVVHKYVEKKIDSRVKGRVFERFLCG